MLQDLKKTSKHTSIYALGNIASKLIGLILIPLYTNKNYLSTSDYGSLAVLEATSQLLIGILTMAMTSGLIRWYWDKKYLQKQKSTFFTTIAFLLLCIVPISFCLVFFADTISKSLFNTIEYSYLLKITIIASSIQIISNQSLTLIRLQSKSRFYVIIQLIKLSSTLGLILWGILKRGKGLDAIWEATLIGELLTLTLLLPYILKNVQFQFNLKVMKEMITYGLPLMLASVSGVLLATADRYMLSSMSGLENTGIYSLGFRIANTLKVIVTVSIMNALIPLKMKKIDDPNNHHFFSKVNTYTVFVFIIALLGLSLFALEGLKLFTGAKIYWQANGIVPFIAYALLFALMRGNTQIGLGIKKKTKQVGFLVFATNVINIILNIIFIPLFDIYGAALATLLSQIFFFVTITRASQKIYYIPYEWRKIMIMIVLSLGIVAMGIIIKDLNLYTRLVIKFILFVSFPFILYFFNFYDRIELENIKAIFNNWKNPKKMKENLKRFTR